MSTDTDRIDDANSRISKRADDRAARFHRTFAGMATPDQARRTLEDIRRLCLADECPAHAAAYGTNRTFHLTGRQAVWREIAAILENKPPKINEQPQSR